MVKRTRTDDYLDILKAILLGIIGFIILSMLFAFFTNQ